jgi:hypothetical protein
VSDDLRKQLESLHGELARTDSVDQDSREVLIRLLGDITRLLDTRPVVDPASDANLAEQLNEAAVQFEAEHPTLSTALRRLVDTLAKAGI